MKAIHGAMEMFTTLVMGCEPRAIEEALRELPREDVEKLRDRINAALASPADACTGARECGHHPSFRVEGRCLYPDAKSPTCLAATPTPTPTRTPHPETCEATETDFEGVVTYRCQKPKGHREMTHRQNLSRGSFIEWADDDDPTPSQSEQSEGGERES